LPPVRHVCLSGFINSLDKFGSVKTGDGLLRGAICKPTGEWHFGKVPIRDMQVSSSKMSRARIFRPDHLNPWTNKIYECSQTSSEYIYQSCWTTFRETCVGVSTAFDKYSLFLGLVRYTFSLSKSHNEVRSGDTDGHNSFETILSPTKSFNCPGCLTRSAILLSLLREASVRSTPQFWDELFQRSYNTLRCIMVWF
jgi:hypothetical protein